MLEHLNAEPHYPARVVVLGAAGFVGGALVKRLGAERVPLLALTRQEVDLLAPDAAERLAAYLNPDDALIAVAAIAPCRDVPMLLDNLAMTWAMARALNKVGVAHVVNISSDAIYADSAAPLTEASCAAPTSYHGMMHLGRELIFKTELRAPLALLRPSLIYGAADPHDGYGPNRFRRQAARGEDIILFGEGEERRDHVLIDDVAEIIARVLQRRSVGVLNIATGEVASFRAIAETVVELSPRAVAIRGTPRQGPMPHGGYRAFDIAACRKAFADFRYTPLAEGLARAQREMAERR